LYDISKVLMNTPDAATTALLLGMICAGSDGGPYGWDVRVPDGLGSFLPAAIGRRRVEQIGLAGDNCVSSA
jgi:hypothetical protein